MKAVAALAVAGAVAIVVATSTVHPARDWEPPGDALPVPGRGHSADRSTPAGATATPSADAGGGSRSRSGGLPYAALASPRWGYAWMDRAIASPGVEVRLDPQWQFTSGRSAPAGADRRVTTVHRATGVYTVRLPDVGYPAGIAHVTSFATRSRHYYSPPVDGHSCSVAGYRPAGADELVDVRCHNRDGSPVDVQFNVFFAAPNAGPGRYASVRYDPPGGAGTLSPISNSGTSNTAGGANHVYHQAAGRWRAVLSGVAPGTDEGYVHVTAYGVGTPARCRPESTGPTAGGTALEVIVACTAITTGAAQPVNSQWTLSYVNRTGLHHAAYLPAAYATTTGDPASPTIDSRHSWASTGETPAVTRLAPGTYRLSYRTLGKPDDAPLVTAVGTLPRHCRLYWWDSYSGPPRVSVDVNCYDPAGNRADSLFALAYLRGP